MPVLKNISELKDFRERAKEQLSDREDNKLTIILGMGTCGIAAGANQVDRAVRSELKKHKLDAEIVNVGCIGMCHNEPLLDIQQPGQPRITYKNVKPAMVGQIIEKHLLNGEFNKRWIYGQLPARDGGTIEGISTYGQLPFYGKQVRIALNNCGMIDPESQLKNTWLPVVMEAWKKPSSR